MPLTDHVLNLPSETVDICKVVRFSLCTKKRRLLICKYAVFTYVREPVHKGEKCLTKWWLTLHDHNFVNNDPILTFLVPIDGQG